MYWPTRNAHTTNSEEYNRALGSDAELPEGHDGAVAADATLLEDEKRFVDLPRSFAMYVEPRWRSTDFAGGPLTEAEYGRLKAGVPGVMRLAPLPPGAAGAGRGARL